MNIFERLRKFLNEVHPDRYLFIVLVFGLLSTFIGGAFFSLAISDRVVGSSAAVVERAVQPSEDQNRISFGSFMNMVKAGAIRSATIDTDKVDAVDDKGEHHIVKHERWLYNFNFPKELSDAGIDVKFAEPVDPEDSSVTGRLMRGIAILTQVLFLLMFVGIGIFLFKSLKNMTSFGWKPEVVKSTVTFADVAGQDETKAELSEMLSFMKNAEAYRRTGAAAPKGLLLVGPPGTGKTLLAKALAGEADASFIALSGSDFANRFIGAGKERIEATFRVARKNKPCIIFIDEIDSVAANRDGSGTDGSREHTTTINKLLTEMDGFKESEGITVLAATNRIDVLDPAILRKGRFDRHIFVNVSDIKGREEILRVHSKEKPLAEDVDLKLIARGIAGFSGADIRNLVNEAAIHAARRNSGALSKADFESARIKIITGVERTSAVLDEADKKLIAVHESGHAVVAAHLANADPMHVATIIPRGAALGMIVQLPEKDLVTIPKSKLLTRLKIYMGGRAAEELVFGPEEVTSGAASDIEEATRIATAMVTVFGMDPSVGMRKVDRINGVLPLVADTAIQTLLDEARLEARRILEENRDGLDRLTSALLARETIYGEEIGRIVRGTAAA
ncbi:ATP-dependent zinc metalloprotease FtsH [Agrobacterium rubi]|nr:ATP-dependent zinc metalloprotease FtsH [Agrobacterium rubi]NTF24560.1 ATP-dependent zinc metalloprotease FtsH [Agrobacterium rubi]